MEIGIVTIALLIAISIAVFLICGRLIGWALGISIIGKNQCTIIEQNDDIEDHLKKLVDIQRALAKSQGIPAEKLGEHWLRDHE